MPWPSVLVEPGALVALVRKRDRYHVRIKEFLSTYFGELVTTWPVLTEAAHLVPAHLGPRIIALANLPRWRVIENGGRRRADPGTDAEISRPPDGGGRCVARLDHRKTGILYVLPLEWADFICA